MDLDGDTVGWHRELKDTNTMYVIHVIMIVNFCHLMQNNWSYPIESDGGIDGHTSDTGVVPSDDTSSWVIGWCTRNLEVNNKLEIQKKKKKIRVRYPVH